MLPNSKRDEAADQYCAVIWISKELCVSVFKLFPNERSIEKLQVPWGKRKRKKKNNQRISAAGFLFKKKTLKEPTVVINEPTINWQFYWLVI